MTSGRLFSFDLEVGMEKEVEIEKESLMHAKSTGKEGSKKNRFEFIKMYGTRSKTTYLLYFKLYF